MNLIHKIKSYFIRHDFHLWKDFDYDGYELKFIELDEETLLEIGHFIKKNLNESAKAYDDRFRLKESTVTICESLDELLPLIREAIRADFKETTIQSLEHNWQFQYFVNDHNSSKNTICVSNGLTSIDGSAKNCIYTVASIRKYKNKYYYWNSLN
ncbi:MAG TPA: hypothetical protein VK528_01815 [Flavobacterium sp.]|nr:hypothetical protein [Flavobacterium sp.]